ncbi:hypothetical protein LPUS_11294 [Lasallia pustulata]|uniref:Uncharacterized protein n=1 Tax=Lasallia pustulata TaxID=136370 RepID=A0A1W5DBG7_9LECA|nr:hypothetical protein LPUS_11294 [Lasallia pustulata]
MPDPSELASPPAMKHYPKAQSTFKPPLISSDNAFLGDIFSRKFAKETVDKAELHNEDIHGSDSDEYPDEDGDNAKGGLADIIEDTLAALNLNDRYGYAIELGDSYLSKEKGRLEENKDHDEDLDSNDETSNDETSNDEASNDKASNDEAGKGGAGKGGAGKGGAGKAGPARARPATGKSAVPATAMPAMVMLARVMLARARPTTARPTTARPTTTLAMATASVVREG